MEADKTIDELVKSLRPVRPVLPYRARLAVWLASTFFVLGAFVAIVGLRRDVLAVFDSGRLAFDAAIVTLLALVSSSSALRLSVPGDDSKVDRLLPLGVLTTWSVVTVAQVATAAAMGGITELVPDRHFACAGLVTAVAAVLSVPLTLLLRRAAPLDRWWCGGLAGLAAASAAMVGIELICVYERPAHLLAWHVVPVILIAAAGAYVGPRLLSQR